MSRQKAVENFKNCSFRIIKKWTGAGTGVLRDPCLRSGGVSHHSSTLPIRIKWNWKFGLLHLSLFNFCCALLLPLFRGNRYPYFHSVGSGALGLCHALPFYFAAKWKKIIYILFFCCLSLLYFPSRYQEKKEKERLEYTIHVWEKINSIFASLSLSVPPTLSLFRCFME